MDRIENCTLAIRLIIPSGAQRANVGLVVYAADVREVKELDMETFAKWTIL